MRWLIALLVLLLSAVVGADNFTGDWTGRWQEPFGGGGITASLTQIGSTVTGRLSISGTDCGPISNISTTGSVSGNVVTFSASTTCQDGTRGEIRFTQGVLSNNVVQGNYATYANGFLYSTGTFRVQRTVNRIFASAGANGSISPTGTITAGAGTNKTFAFTPSAGYRVSNVLVDGVSIGAPASYTFTNLAANHTIRATFGEIITHSISATAGVGGSITPSGTLVIEQGGSQQFSIAAAPGYRLVDVNVDGVSVGAVTSYTFSNVVADRRINASFEAITYTITAAAGKGGTITPSGAVVVAERGSQQFSIVPESGYQLVDVKVDGVSVGPVRSYTFSNVVADHRISASFRSSFLSIAPALNLLLLP